MTNKRQKMDAEITMDEVDGFSAKELFGQGAPSPPRSAPLDGSNLFYGTDRRRRFLPRR
jgi:hypothetical protein